MFWRQRHINKCILNDTWGQSGHTYGRLFVWREKITPKAADTCLSIGNPMFVGQAVCGCLPTIGDANLKAGRPILLEAMNSCGCYEDVRAQLAHNSICGGFGGIGRFVGYQSGKNQSSALEEPYNHQERIEDKGPPIFRRLIVAIFLNLSGYSIAVWGISHFNDKRRILRASLIIVGWLWCCMGFLLVWASNFTATWHWWV